MDMNKTSWWIWPYSRQHYDGIIFYHLWHVLMYTLPFSHIIISKVNIEEEVLLSSVILYWNVLVSMGITLS